MTAPSASRRQARRRRGAAARRAIAATPTWRNARPPLQRGRPHRLRDQPPVLDSALVDRERFDRTPRRAHRARRSCVPAAHDGHAGGVAVRRPDPRLGARRGRPRGRGRASTPTGCGALTAAGSAAVTLVEGELLLDAARVGTRAIAAELGGLSPGKLHAADLAADALHRALGAAARRRRGRARRRAHAGRDERRRGLRGRRAARRARRDAVAVTLELWRDAENDAAASCCSADAVRLARSVAHRMGMPHFTLDLRAGVPRGRRRPVPGRLRGGGDPEPVRRLQRPRAPGRDARPRRRGSGAPTSPPATTRGSPTTGCCASRPTRPRTRPTCSPRWRRPRWRGCASRSPS